MMPPHPNSSKWFNFLIWGVLILYGMFSDGMFRDGTFSDWTFSDGMFSDGTFCMWIKNSPREPLKNGVFHIITYNTGTSKYLFEWAILFLCEKKHFRAHTVPIQLKICLECAMSFLCENPHYNSHRTGTSKDLFRMCHVVSLWKPISALAPISPGSGSYRFRCMWFPLMWTLGQLHG